MTKFALGEEVEAGEVVHVEVGDDDRGHVLRAHSQVAQQLRRLPKLVPLRPLRGDVVGMVGRIHHHRPVRGLDAPDDVGHRLVALGRRFGCTAMMPDGRQFSAMPTVMAKILWSMKASLWPAARIAVGNRNSGAAARPPRSAYAVPTAVLFPCIRGNVYTPPMGTEEAVFREGMTDVEQRRARGRGQERREERPVSGMPAAVLREMLSDACDIVRETRAVIEAALEKGFTHRSKADGTFVTDVDIAVEEKVRTLLAARLSGPSHHRRGAARHRRRPRAHLGRRSHRRHPELPARSAPVRHAAGPARRRRADPGGHRPAGSGQDLQRGEGSRCPLQRQGPRS